MKINNKIVGARIKEIRSEKGMSQEEFGSLISNAHKSLVSKWEKGQSLPNNERLKKIAELGNISVNELLYGNIHNYVKNIVIKNIENEAGGRLVANTITNVLMITNHWSGSFPDENTVIAALESYQKELQDRKQKEPLCFGKSILNVKNNVIELDENFEKLSDKEKKRILSTIFDNIKDLEVRYSSLFEMDIQEVEDELKYLENE